MLMKFMAIHSVYVIGPGVILVISVRFSFKLLHASNNKFFEFFMMRHVQGIKGLRNDMSERIFYKERKINNRSLDFLSKQNIKIPLIITMYANDCKYFFFRIETALVEIINYLTYLKRKQIYKQIQSDVLKIRM